MRRSTLAFVLAPVRQWRIGHLMPLFGAEIDNAICADIRHRSAERGTRGPSQQRYKQKQSREVGYKSRN